jgi:hypothetical protein
VHSKYVSVHGDRLMFITQDSRLVSYSLSGLLDARKDFYFLDNELPAADFAFDNDLGFIILRKRGELRVGEKNYKIQEMVTPQVEHWTTFGRTSSFWVVAGWNKTNRTNHLLLLENPYLSKLDTAAIKNAVSFTDIDMSMPRSPDHPILRLECQTLKNVPFVLGIRSHYCVDLLAIYNKKLLLIHDGVTLQSSTVSSEFNYSVHYSHRLAMWLIGGYEQILGLKLKLP